MHIDKCMHNETDMSPGVETEIQSEVGTDLDEEVYSVNDSGDLVTVWYWILFESNKKHSKSKIKQFWANFSVSGEGVGSAIRKVNSDAY